MLSDGSLAAIAASAGPLPLAVSVDEEGGRVSRLAALIGSQPSPRSWRRPKPRTRCTTSPSQRGRAMKKLGITVDFAPVADVTDAPDDTVIGDRSFGADPATVTDYAGAYAHGLRDAGLLPVLKHFPGHGHGSGDSHTGSVVTPPIADLQNDDLIPYRTLAVPGAGRCHGRAFGGTRADRHRPGKPEPSGLCAAAVGRLRWAAVQRPGVHRRPVQHASHQRSVRGRARLRCAALQAGADTALWVTTDEVPAVLDRLEKALCTPAS